MRYKADEADIQADVLRSYGDPREAPVSWMEAETPADPFREIVGEMLALKDRKEQDYGADEDPLRNVRSAADYGVPPWVGCAIRMGDKMRRLQAFAKKGELANESVEDSLLDIANYAILALILYRESGDAGRDGA